ncbi:MAG: HlyD family efflux transporter periplasmic adaptor subunit [Planctomycetales bacterium]|nr:HlyD family efflux transporter periplasmic adaptor subunit [Planctomycetales bacterium]
MTKFVLLSTLGALIAGAVAILDHQSTDLTAGARDFDAARGAAPVSIYAAGVVEGAHRDVELFPETTGRVVACLVEVNDWVETGQVLVQLDDRWQQQQLASSKAGLELAQAQLERLENGARESERNEARALYNAKLAQLDQARRTWERIRELRLKNAVSPQEADDQRSLVDTLTAELSAARARLEQIEAAARADEIRMARARVAAAEAGCELAEVMLDRTILRAPNAGRVLDIHAEPGQLLGPDSPTPAVVLADTSALRVRAYVEEIDAPRLAVGLPVILRADGLPDRTFQGRVASLSPRMKRKTLDAGRSNELYDTKIREVLLTVDDASDLLIGLRVDVTIDARLDATTTAGER